MKYIKVKVVAGSKTESLVQTKEDAFLIHTRQPPKEGRATRQAMLLLAAHLNVDIQRIIIVRGHTTPNKLVILHD